MASQGISEYDARLLRAAHPVYQENKQFFYDLVAVPILTDERKVDKDVINEAVYGKKWREKMTKSPAQESVKQ